MDQLRDEIDRISDSANFNGIKLLDGTQEADAAVGTVSAVTVTAGKDGSQGVAEVQGKIQINLSQFSITETAANSADVTALTFGGATFSGLTVGNIAASGGVISGATIAAAVSGLTIELGGIEFTAKDEGNGIITLTSETGFTAAEVTAFDNLTLDFSVTSGATVNQGEGIKAHIINKPVAAVDSLLAQGSFTLSDAMVKDGAKLNIGGTEYTFAVGKDSKVTGANVIDLKNEDPTSTGLGIKAANLLSAAGATNNEKFIITTDGKGSIGLTEKEGKVDYKTEWDLKGGNGTNDGVWNTKVGSTDTKTGVVSWTSAPVVSADAKTGLTFQIGDTAESFNQLNLSIGDIHCSALGIDGISIADQKSAQAAVQSIKDAINKVSGIRGDLGATQNRLEHTANNLSVMQENITDAESSIRDTDVAEEMMAYTKNNILIQAAQAMLAQANQIPQGVLQLLQ
ncbi:MAG: hypothetical protein HFJ80_05315 [Clostridiales bacterium]|nr:hypothetical protein [Clostridiales bacterium]